MAYRPRQRRQNHHPRRGHLYTPLRTKMAIVTISFSRRAYLVRARICLLEECSIGISQQWLSLGSTLIYVRKENGREDTGFCEAEQLPTLEK